MPQYARLARPFHAFCLILLISASWACKQDPKEIEQSYQDFSDCKYSSPKPLFKPGMHLVKKHQFRPDKTASSEQVVFDNGVALELIQSGCNKARQEFRFLLRGDFSKRDEATWISVAAGLFKFISTVDPSLMPFQQWSKAILEKKKQMRVGQPLEVQPGFLVAVDRVISPDVTTLVIVLTEL